jgi:hypothetical protein
VLYCFYLLYYRLSCLSEYSKSTNTLYFREFGEFFVRYRSTTSHAFVNNISYRIFTWDIARIAFSHIFTCHNHYLDALKFNCFSRFCNNPETKPSRLTNMADSGKARSLQRFLYRSLHFFYTGIEISRVTFQSATGSKFMSATFYQKGSYLIA